MNQLQFETSPYLLQHADNPVQWHPWNETSLSRARTGDKPILLSIGYSSCHWCHVMERESFQDPEIAACMNAWFVNIKVDREERPDLDALYLEACELLTGTAGWPLNVFLTPDLKPFFAGTYFPPEPAHRRMSWLQALQYVQYNYQEQRAAVERQAERILARLKDPAGVGANGKPNGPDAERSLPAEIFEELKLQFDRTSGGFGTGPKFPNTMALEFLLNYFYYYRDPEALRHFRFTVSTLLKSGMYDQIGGGIARYTVDREWRIPHFEKMLYDNALLVQLLARAYRLIGRRKYKTALLQTLDFLEREMRSPEGAFYAALDADSQEQEGRYYTWSKEEISNILGDEAELFCTYFGITAAGNWEGTNILYQPTDRFQLADSMGKDREALLERIHAARKKILAARARRFRLQRDEKIILGWNALMVSAYVQAYLATGEESYRKAGAQLLQLLLGQFYAPEEQSCYRIRSGGKMSHPATLRDYAYLIRAILDVFSLSGDRSLLKRAVSLTDQVQRLFLQRGAALFSYARTDLPDLIRDRKDLIDEDMPSGNALMLRNLQDLAILKGDKKYHKLATGLLSHLTEATRSNPLAHAYAANAVLASMEGVLEIAVVGKDAEVRKNDILSGYLPFAVVVAAEKPDQGLPLLAGKHTGEDTLIYVCRDYSCEAPIGDPQIFAKKFFKPPDLSTTR